MREIEFTKANGASTAILRVAQAFEVKTIGEYLDKGGLNGLKNAKLRNCGAATYEKLLIFIESHIK